MKKGLKVGLIVSIIIVALILLMGFFSPIFGGQICSLVGCFDSIEVILPEPIRGDVEIIIDGKRISTCETSLRIYKRDEKILINSIIETGGKERIEASISVSKIDCRTNETEIVYPDQKYTLSFIDQYPNGRHCSAACKKATLNLK